MRFLSGRQSRTGSYLPLHRPKRWRERETRSPFSRTSRVAPVRRHMRFGMTVEGARWDEDANRYTWSPDENVPTEEVIGAASVVIDSRRTAHLILRDSSSFELAYYTRTLRGGWSSGETAVDANSIEEIDFPVLTVDQTSRLVYVFLQTTDNVPQIRVAIRDPASGWEGPYSVTSSASFPDGAGYPTSIEEANGLPIVLWTRGGGSSTIQAARVAAP